MSNSERIKALESKVEALTIANDVLETAMFTYIERITALKEDNERLRTDVRSILDYIYSNMPLPDVDEPGIMDWLEETIHDEPSLEDTVSYHSGSDSED